MLDFFRKGRDPLPVIPKQYPQLVVVFLWYVASFIKQANWNKSIFHVSVGNKYANYLSSLWQYCNLSRGALCTWEIKHFSNAKISSFMHEVLTAIKNHPHIGLGWTLRWKKFCKFSCNYLQNIIGKFLRPWGIHYHRHWKPPLTNSKRNLDLLTKGMEKKAECNYIIGKYLTLHRYCT